MGQALKKTATETISTRSTPLRPAQASEIDQAHTWLMQAIETSTFYNDTFKAHEKARLTRGYLQKLHDANPGHIMLMISDDQPVGIMISSPEYGTLWLQWSYLLPEKRRGGLAMGAIRTFIEYWDNGHFHKIATYTKHGNEAAVAIMQRYGFEHICTLEKHIFGEDYLLYEKPLTKVTKDYDHGIANEGRLGRLKRWAKNLL